MEKTTQANNFDCIIIGGGPAGVTAGIYATRAGLKTVIIEEMVVGGQASFTYEIDNYPGFSKISGMELGTKFAEHAENLGVEMVFDSITHMELEGEQKTIETAYSGTYTAKTAILCLGAKPRKLGLPNEEQFIGKGLSFCATCDGAFHAGKTVAVVGGGNSALEEALFLAKTSEKVHLVHMLGEYQANHSMIQKVLNEPKIECHLNSQVVELHGQDMLSSITIKNSQTNEIQEINLSGLFVAIGRVPSTEPVKEIVETDAQGYIVSNEDMQTNVAGVFVAGDVRQKKIRQIVTACSDGAIAAISANSYIIENQK